VRGICRSWIGRDENGGGEVGYDSWPAFAEPGFVGPKRRVPAADGAVLWQLFQAGGWGTRLAVGRRDALWSSLVPGPVRREDRFSVIVLLARR